MLRHRLRATSLLTVAALIATACAGATDTADGPQVSVTASADGSVGSDGGTGDGSTDGGSDGPGGDDQTNGTSAGDSGGEAGAGDSGDAGTDAGTETSQPSGPLPARTNDLAGVGFHGAAMLRGSIANLIVEVDVQQGVQADSAAVNFLVDRIRQYVDKPGGVTLAGGNTFVSDRTEWTSDDLRAIAEANRSNYSSGDTVVVYVIYADGGFHSGGEQTNAIGVAYNASEFAVFPGRWAGLGSLLGSDRAIEQSVLVHEWGHLLGLVNIGYSSTLSHEDPDHPHHSSNDESVMYWAIETDLIGQFFNGAPPDDFDDADRADMEGIRDGSLVS